MRKLLRSVLMVGVVTALVSPVLAAHLPAEKAEPRLPSSISSQVVVYQASWCSACRVLERGLRERDIPFDMIDVEKNQAAFAKARSATGTSAIPQTSVDRGSGDPVWIVGANVDAIERAYKGQ